MLNHKEMKKLILVFCLVSVYITSLHGQWYARKYYVTDINLLSQQQLETSMKVTKNDLYGSLAITGLGGGIILLEKLNPYKSEDDDNQTIIEQLLGETGVYYLILAAGIGIAVSGAIASIYYSGRLGTIRSALNRNFPYLSSLKLVPSIALEINSHSICPGFTFTYNF
jgi:hypothetical protein